MADNKVTLGVLAWRIAVSVMAGILAITGYLVVDKLGEVNALEAEADGLKEAVHMVKLENQTDHAEIRLSLAKIQSGIPTEIPPRWFEQEVRQLESKVDRLMLAIEKQDSRLMLAIEKQDSDAWHRTQMAIWCAEFQRLNPDAEMPVVTTIPH